MTQQRVKYKLFTAIDAIPVARIFARVNGREESEAFVDQKRRELLRGFSMNTDSVLIAYDAEDAKQKILGYVRYVGADSQEICTLPNDEDLNNALQERGQKRFAVNKL